ncbi:hypothetical protein BIFGAL_04316 [Bifidobacterium gallicum DSM 20093 = LMG 11596]|uniref:Uncharacterized protein n=1 Tax=Bifidobacterium gallicum DSM 20093 = LMG 11596 TaxID=561180 RepID=D1NWR0_9BIFI|nr:hypothetical protein BIFGAL_04316 [Bifidobacterium gallicum DSM 20093 = LMG 11596]
MRESKARIIRDGSCKDSVTTMMSVSKLVWLPSPFKMVVCCMNRQDFDS